MLQTSFARGHHGALGVLIFTLALPALSPEPVFAAESSAGAASAAGFLYGKITMRSGTVYEGRLRWDDEEAFWGDFFNSSKDDNPWVDLAPRRERERSGRRIKVFGIEISGTDGWHDDSGRQFVSRFGDIAKLEPQGDDEVLVTLKNGTTFELDGGSNDIGAEINVWDQSLGKVEVGWRRIRSIELMAPPRGLTSAETRLFGTVQTRDGEFTGYVQWDQEECLGSDELDGDSEDGSLSLRMGRIKSIERRSGRSARVTLIDGREMVMSDTNDVDRSNRGIHVEDPRFGRVLVSWEAFDRVDFTLQGSGPAYDDYPPGSPLAGTVTTRDGRKLTGRLVYDLDESETTEMLDGESRDINYNIPFSLVAAVVPRGDGARVELRSGETLNLEGTADTSPDNAGVLVFTGAGDREKPSYVTWDDVERIDFEAPQRSWPPTGKLPAERAP